MSPAPVGLLLAAGRGARFDATGQALKLTQPAPRGPRAGTPLAVAAARALHEAGLPVIAVVRPAADAAQRELHAMLAAEGCRLIVNADADAGMGTSLSVGVRAASDASGWIVALADMPAIRATTIRAVADALTAGLAVVAPSCRGTRGHPVGFARHLFNELVALAGDQGARVVLTRHPPHLLAVDDAGVLDDIDTRADLA